MPDDDDSSEKFKLVAVATCGLPENAGSAPLYSQVASTATEGLRIDNVCYTDAYYDYGVVDFAMAITFQNMNTSTTFLRQIEVEPGVFLLYGDSDFYDFILGVPCWNTYVIYRCFYRRLPCPTTVDGVIVIIESSEEFVSDFCIERGIKIAERQFPGIRFYTLPRRFNNNCYNFYYN